MFKKLLFAGLLMSTAASMSQAALVETELPTNTFISQSGLDWAWAYPLPSSGSGFDLSFQSAFGWRIPTLSELGLAPDAVDFMFSGANVPLGGADPISGASFPVVSPALTGDAACATPYFSTNYRHCDWQDGQGQAFGPWSGLSGAGRYSEQLVVRDASSPAPVPAPASLLLIGLGLASLGFARRKRG